MKIWLFSFIFLSSTLKTYADDMNRYIGGDEWSKLNITKNLFNNSDAIIQDLILRTAKLSNRSKKTVGTAFLIDETESYYIFLTNYHVMGRSRQCKNSKLLMIDQFMNKHVLKCSKSLKVGSIKSGSDYHYFSVQKNSKSSFLSHLQPMKIITSDPTPGDKLAMVGFGEGSFSTSTYDGKLISDNDCVYLHGNSRISLNGEIVKDVFFHACDNVQGDSGSAVINRDTGELVGLYFGSVYYSPKNPLTSQEIHQNLGSVYSDFLRNSAFAIDIRKIKY